MLHNNLAKETFLCQKEKKNQLEWMCWLKHLHHPFGSITTLPLRYFNILCIHYVCCVPSMNFWVQNHFQTNSHWKQTVSKPLKNTGCDKYIMKCEHNKTGPLSMLCIMSCFIRRWRAVWLFMQHVQHVAQVHVFISCASVISTSNTFAEKQLKERRY